MCCLQENLLYTSKDETKIEKCIQKVGWNQVIKRANALIKFEYMFVHVAMCAI